MTEILAEVVTPPTPRGQRYGLFTAATGPLDLPSPDGLANGIKYQPMGCGRTEVSTVVCDDNTPFTEYDDLPDWVYAEPLIVRAKYKCRPVGLTETQLEDLVRAKLQSGEQGSAEEALGALLDINASAVPVGDSSSIRSVVGELEQWLYGTNGYGHYGFIHASPLIASFAAAAGLIRQDGATMRTPFGSYWVFGGGYPTPDRLYVTGNVTVWRSQDVTVTRTFDRRYNWHRLVADRPYAVAYDCLAGRADFDSPIAAS